MSTGRAAFALLMSVVREARADEARNEVIVPAYTCYSVPASVIRSGLRVRLCDVDPVTLTPDLDDLRSIDLRRVAAIVSANLYGYPNDLPEMETLASQHGVLLVDDAAQALGARVSGRHAGSFGAAGLFSFDKGKNITTILGGALVLRNTDLLQRFEARYQTLPRTTVAATAALWAKLFGYAVALRPVVYEYVRRISLLGLGRTPFETDFPIERFPESLATVGLEMLHRLPEIAAIRKRNAIDIQQALTAVPGIRVLKPLVGAEPAYTRLPIFVDDPDVRRRLIAASLSHGIGATVSYPNALCDVPELSGHLDASDHEKPGARLVARSIVTLPTHPYCPRYLALKVRQIAESVTHIRDEAGAPRD